MRKFLDSFTYALILFLLLASLCMAVWIKSAHAETYSAAVWAWDASDRNGWIVEPITMDGVVTSFDTPHNFTGLSGAHNFTIPNIDVDGNMFYNWTHTSAAAVQGNTITVVTNETCTAHYYPPYNVTIEAWDSEHGNLNERIWIDEVDTGFKTPHTFTGLGAEHAFMTSRVDVFGNVFGNWTTGSIDTTIFVDSNGTYTAQYYPYSVTIWAWDSLDRSGWINEPIKMDGVVTAFSTPHSFSGLSGEHNFTLPYIDVDGNAFSNWTGTGNFGYSENTIVTTEDVVCTGNYYLPYIATIEAWDSEHGSVKVSVNTDFNNTTFTTPCTFAGLGGNQSFLIPLSDAFGDPFGNWSTGLKNPMLTVASGGTYIAQYYPYTVTILALDSIHGYTSVPITMDGIPTGSSTPHNFTGLSGTHNYTVPSADAYQGVFGNWSYPLGNSTIFVANPTLTAGLGVIVTARYYSSNAIPEFDSLPFLMVTLMAASVTTLVLRRNRKNNGKH